MNITGASSGVPAGVVAFFAASTAPAGWLKANGAAVSRAAYSALFAAIGTTHGEGDGATTFNLPDLRGEFIRCWDDGRGVDAGRAFGGAQVDQIKSHAHAIKVGGGAGGTSPVRSSDGTITEDSGYNGGAETRPRNVAHLGCIKC